MTSASDTVSTAGAPLAGRSVVVTRSAEQSATITALLEELGAEVIVCPVIALIDPPEPQRVLDAITDLAEYDWLVLTSTNAVERFLGHEAFGGAAASAIASAGVKVAAVGRSTADCIARHGVNVDLVPKDFRGEGLVEEFQKMGAGKGWRLLVPRALKAREVLRTQLGPLGVEVDVVPVYETVPAQPDSAVFERIHSAGMDAVTFTSPSTFRNFLAVLERAGLNPANALDGVVTASIGPVTSDAMRAAGFEPVVEADPSTVPALVEALASCLTQRPKGL